MRMVVLISSTFEASEFVTLSLIGLVFDATALNVRFVLCLITASYLIVASRKSGRAVYLVI